MDEEKQDLEVQLNEEDWDISVVPNRDKWSLTGIRFIPEIEASLGREITDEEWWGMSIR